MPICPNCSEFIEPDDADDIVAVDGGEVFDLIAEAAITSHHARRAYGLMRDANPAIMPLEARMRLIATRKSRAVE